MGGGMYGADVAQLRGLAATFDRAADRLDQARASLQSRVERSAAWRGNDGDRFRAAWNGEAAPAIRGSVTGLRTAAHTLRTNADQQESASRDGGTMISTGAVSTNSPLSDVTSLLHMVGNDFEPEREVAEAALYSLGNFALAAVTARAVLAYELGVRNPGARRIADAASADARARWAYDHDSTVRDQAKRDAEFSKLADTSDPPSVVRVPSENGLKPWNTEVFSESSSGASATVFTDSSGNIVVAFQGTNFTSEPDVGTDIDNFRGLSTAQAAWAIALAQREATRAREMGGTVSFTGHSLGGSLAATAALATGAPAVTFNAAGIGNGNYALAEAAAGGHVSEGNIVNYSSTGDPLTAVQGESNYSAAGSQVTMPYNAVPGSVDAHDWIVRSVPYKWPDSI